MLPASSNWKASGRVAEKTGPRAQYSATQTMMATLARPVASINSDLLSRTSSLSLGSMPALRRVSMKLESVVPGLLILIGRFRAGAPAAI